MKAKYIVPENEVLVAEVVNVITTSSVGPSPATPDPQKKNQNGGDFGGGPVSDNARLANTYTSEIFLD